MRELAKSALSFSWAISLLSVKQAVNLARPGHQARDDAFTPITQAAVNQLDDSMKGIYRFGDNIQKQMVDIAFWWMDPNLTHLSKWGFGRAKEADSPEKKDATDASMHTGEHRTDTETCCGEPN